MKLASFVLAALLAIKGALATPDAVAAPDTANKITSQQEAFETVKGLELPAGVTLTGAVDAIKEPAKKPEGAEAGADLTTPTGDHDDHKEWFGGYGGFGGWGGWGGLGPYRFGFSCGSIGGWAYPLGYWNTFGFGLYGGGCSLGIPFSGLFYC
ncbi:unnamed protein product [Globisporangium polare]